jgi:hypothetical protein
MGPGIVSFTAQQRSSGGSGSSLEHTAKIRDRSNILTPCRAPSEPSFGVEDTVEYREHLPDNSDLERFNGRAPRFGNVPRHLVWVGRYFEVQRTACFILCS